MQPYPVEQAEPSPYPYPVVGVDGGADPLLSIPGIIQQVSDGGVAILVLLLVAARWFGGDIKRYLAAQVDTLDKLKSDIVTNSSTLKTLADTDNKVADTIGTMAKDHASIESKLSEIATLNEELHNKTHSLLEELTSVRDSHDNPR